MSNRTLLNTPAIVVDGKAIMENTEDGFVPRIQYYVGVEIDGGYYSYSILGGRYSDAADMADRINAMGSVNLDKWCKLDAYDRRESEEYNLREEVDAGDWG